VLLFRQVVWAKAKNTDYIAKKLALAFKFKELFI